VSNLRDLRRKKSLTLEDAGKGIKINTSTLSRIERGVHFPSPESAKKIASFYGKKLGEIYTLVSEESSIEEHIKAA